MWSPARRADPPGTKSASEVSAGLRIAGLAVRAVFIACLLAITALVSMPQNETLWSAYETAGDLVRVALGFAVCVWITMQLFRIPKDAQSYRTWVYLGAVGIPFALICLLILW
jgi:hypothetical protein